MHTTPSLPVPATTIATLINAFQAERGLSDDDIANHLGFPQGNVVTCIRTGRMRLPLGKLTLLADMLDMDPERIVELALMEHDHGLLPHFKALQARCQVTPEEQRLLEHCRALAGGRALSSFIIDGRSVVALMVS